VENFDFLPFKNTTEITPNLAKLAFKFALTIARTSDGYDPFLFREIISGEQYCDRASGIMSTVARHVGEAIGADTVTFKLNKGIQHRTAA
jgi:hypothetical protein